MMILSLSNTITGKAMGSKQISIHHVGLSNPAISEFCHPSYMAITLNNFKIFLSLLCGWSSHPTISKFCQFPTWKFFELLIRFKILFFGRRQKLNDDYDDEKMMMSNYYCHKQQCVSVTFFLLVILSMNHDAIASKTPHTCM